MAKASDSKVNLDAPRVAGPRQQQQQQQQQKAKGRGASLREMGNSAFCQEMFQEAIDFYTRGLEVESDPVAILANRSAAYARLKQWSAALADAKAALAHDPNFAKAYLRMGDALEGMLMYSEAHNAYRRGLELDPESGVLQAAADRVEGVLSEMTEEERSMRAPNPDSDRFDALVSWLRDGGARFPALYLKYYSEEYRGVHALARVPSDAVCLYVPESHIMTTDKAKESVVGRRLLERHVDLRSKHSFLACYLLEEREKGRASFWHPYIGILPSKFRNVPINFSEDELGLLRGSLCVEKIQDRRDSLRREYDNIARMVPEFGSVHTYDDFVWARLVVITRIFGLVIRGCKTDGLVPYADMLNHKRPRETMWSFNDAMGGFAITTLRPLQRGDEVFDSYGRKCNSRFFVNYGFALLENDDNEALLHVELPKTDPHFLYKLRLLGGGGGGAGVDSSGRRAFQASVAIGDKKVRELFSFLRVVHADDRELVFLPSDHERIAEGLEPVSVANELAVLADLGRAADRALAQFDTTKEQDDAELQQLALLGPLSASQENARNAITMRRGEKVVLLWYKNLASVASSMLPLSVRDFRAEFVRLNAALDRDEPTKNYLLQVVLALLQRAEQVSVVKPQPQSQPPRQPQPQ